jgi:2-polyprenyl-3-methyl-5-hydroxy-6-metoxy-1,4-benzoquinol methylase
MASGVCPACSSSETETLDCIKVSELAGLYARSLNVDISAYVEGVNVIHLQRCRSCDLRFFDPPCPGDASFYEQMQRLDWYYLDAKPEYDFAKHYVAEHSAVLEVGCGKGAFRAFLPESVAYTGLEFNDAAVAMARSLGLNVLRLSIGELAASDCTRYDVVCSFQVMEHVPDVADFVRDCIRLLKPSGMLVLAVPAEDSYLSIAVNAITNMPPHHVTRWSDDALLALARRERLSVLALWHEPIAPFHRAFVAHVLARHWFVSHRLGSHRLLDRSEVARATERLLSYKTISRFCAHSSASRYVHSARGHTVVLVATLADP